MEAITIPHIHIPSIDISGICLPGIGVPDGGKKGLIWPKGLKESIKAIYDPASQGMTNYDVIEAYAEDFTNWTLDNSNGIATVIKNEIHITESIVYYRSVVRQDKVRGTQPFKVLISGLTDSQAVQYIYNDGKSYVTKKLTTNGVHELPASSTQRNGFNVEPAGACDVTIKQLPTSMLQDLSGNGNHAYLYGGKGKLNSGIGVYGIDVTENIIQPNRFEYLYDNITKEVTFVKALAAGTYLFFINKNIVNSTQQIKIAGIDRPIHFVNSTTNETYYSITEDGIYDIDFVTDADTVIRTSYTTNQELNLRVQFLPYYPNQLCYDGKMYAVCYGFPILEDYTVIADRTWFDNMNRACFLSKTIEVGVGAFLFEIFGSNNTFDTYSYGNINNVKPFETGITYQTKKSYNGNSILSGNFNDSDVLTIGKIRPTEYNGYVGCHGKIIIADRSFPIEWINWLKENFFTIDIPTPAYDFDFSKLKSGETTFTDKYGNKLSLHNFAWSEMSGKDGYLTNFRGWRAASSPHFVTDIQHNQFILTSVLQKSTNGFVYKWAKDVTNEIPSYAIEVKGIDSIAPGFLSYQHATEEISQLYFDIKQDGIHILPKCTTNIRTWCGFVIRDFAGECNLTVRLIPLYPQALVFDGVDDYAMTEPMTIKTIIVDAIFFSLNKIVYDNRVKGEVSEPFALYNETGYPAYDRRNTNGLTYINGELNTSVKSDDLLNKRYITCLTNDAVKNNQFIGVNRTRLGYFADIALYRITGFTEVLTPDQIWKWYQKNQPKGGDK